jgi:adenosylhomocysteine nucleosidase
MRTRLVVAAEAREFSGILKRTTTVRRLDLPGATYAREIVWNKDRWLLVANGPGARLVLQALDAAQALEIKRNVDQVLNIGFCGALDPSLRVGDVLDSRGLLTTADRVAITAAEKRRLYESTGAAAVEMECEAVEIKAREWGVPFRCVKAVSDVASEDLPLDFNKYRDREGRFSRIRIACAALARPFRVIPGLVRLDRNCRVAADQLGEFLANSVF